MTEYAAGAGAKVSVVKAPDPTWQYFSQCTELVFFLNQLVVPKVYHGSPSTAHFQCEDLGVDKHALSVASDQGSGAGPEYPHTAVACRMLVQGLTKVLKDKMKHPDVGTLGRHATVFFVPQKQFARG